MYIWALAQNGFEIASLLVRCDIAVAAATPVAAALAAMTFLVALSFTFAQRSNSVGSVGRSADMHTHAHTHAHVHTHTVAKPALGALTFVNACNGTDRRMF